MDGPRLASLVPNRPRHRREKITAAARRIRAFNALTQCLYLNEWVPAVSILRPVRALHFPLTLSAVLY